MKFVVNSPTSSGFLIPKRNTNACSDDEGRDGTLSLFNSPFLLGFDELERALDRVSKTSSDGYPPYNIERTGEDDIKISLAVAGFSPAELSVNIEDTQLFDPRKTR